MSAQQQQSSKKKKEKKALPEHIELQRTHVICGPEMNSHVNTFTSANVFRPLGVDNSWDLEEFKEGFQIKINKLDDMTMEFDMIGIDPAIANALRRVLIAEIPTMAIEHVFVVNNTSIIQDEVFAHRLGLVPLKIDPSLFDFKTADEAPSEKNTVVLKLDVTCRRQGDRVVNDKVMSSELQWLPQGSEMPEETSCRFAQGQKHMFVAGDEPRSVHPDILLAKLRPGQTMQLEAHCVKGIAKTHAKWSPVATAWYRLLPEVVLLKDVDDEEMVAELLETAPGLFYKDGQGKLRAGQARGHEMVLEKVRCLLDQERYARVVQYRKRKDHFIFTIESTGIIPPEKLLEQALQILQSKAERLATRL